MNRIVSKVAAAAIYCVVFWGATWAVNEIAPERLGHFLCAVASVSMARVGWQSQEQDT